ncbi:MAG: dihydroorotase family protein [Candidatus Cloacimonetes bacterium]|nr:dihydroorotase family protein [Candidatus Cloacimonadota bacterium]
MPNRNVYHDFHVHVGERIGGYNLRDDFADLNRLCGQSGRSLGAIGVFVTEESRGNLKDKYQRMLERAREDYSQEVFWHLSPVQSSPDEVIPLLGKHTDIKLYSTYRNAGLYSSYEQIERWMDALAGKKTRILVHCEDDATVEEYSARYPFKRPHDHCLRRPELAEIRAVERVLDLAVSKKHPVHIVHVSSPQSALLIKEAKSQYPGISCETAPHYLLFNEDQLKQKNAHQFLCTPPFRKEESRGMMVELLQDNVFDILASDHCAFTDADKDRYKDDPEQVPCGIPGINTLYSSMESTLVNSGKLSLEALDRMLRIIPAKLMNLEDRIDL